MPAFLLAIDQGTTNSRAIIFDREGHLISQHEAPLNQSFPHDGWVEQDPLEMFQLSILCCQEALKKAKLTANDIAAIGISNQRETTILWDKKSGEPIYPAIVWQDRRTSEYCQQLATTALNQRVPEKTGLLLDPYFSATKIAWLLEQVPQCRERANRGELLFGTVDTYLIWKMTNGRNHVTDATNASRTMLFNIHTHEWDAELLEAFAIPANLLPTVLDSSAYFGEMEAALLGKTIPITGVAGDQQAATIGQACFNKGMVKTTYGTGCFMLLNTGDTCIRSENKLLSTIAYRINQKTTYGLEGSIFSAGTTIKWLRDKLKLIETAAETEELAKSITNTEGAYLVPAFTGLGAPYWDPLARGALIGLTRNHDKAHIARAALECVAYQTRDLLDAMREDKVARPDTIRVDGGMAANNWLLQFLADVLDVPVERPASIETSALGAAYLAGLQVGFYQSLDDISKHWHIDARFQPMLSEAERNKLLQGWKQAVTRVRSHAPI
ncbi:MAG: glycerol kinase [Gammaproteobacteria bacterium RIFCSPHIGHO2_12_FULL_42_13]|nr:MAG: glycerol kinase [Gammaproteobacteria bacterium RIFCSPHIGHO2_12_FULL_42_13]